MTTMTMISVNGRRWSAINYASLLLGADDLYRPVGLPGLRVYPVCGTLTAAVSATTYRRQTSTFLTSHGTRCAVPYIGRHQSCLFSAMTLLLRFYIRLPRADAFFPSAAFLACMQNAIHTAGWWYVAVKLRRDNVNKLN